LIRPESDPKFKGDSSDQVVFPEILPDVWLIRCLTRRLVGRDLQPSWNPCLTPLALHGHRVPPKLDEEGENSFGEHDGREGKQITTAPGLEFGRRERRTGVTCTAAGETREIPSPRLLFFGKLSMSSSDPPLARRLRTHRGRTCSIWDRDVRSPLAPAERCGATLASITLFSRWVAISARRNTDIPSV